MELLLVRHAPAEKRNPRAWPDDDMRPLTSKGGRAFTRAARGIFATAPVPGIILASPALRTLQTARILAEAAGRSPRRVIAVPALHHAVSARTALAALAALALPRAAAVVGHEPNLGELASLLLFGRSGAGLPFRKGGACLIEADAPAPGAGRLVWFLDPIRLAALRR